MYVSEVLRRVPATRFELLIRRLLEAAHSEGDAPTIAVHTRSGRCISGTLTQHWRDEDESVLVLLESETRDRVVYLREEDVSSVMVEDPARWIDILSGGAIEFDPDDPEVQVPRRLELRRRSAALAEEIGELLGPAPQIDIDWDVVGDDPARRFSLDRLLSSLGEAVRSIAKEAADERRAAFPGRVVITADDHRDVRIDQGVLHLTAHLSRGRNGRPDLEAITRVVDDAL